MTRAIDSVVVSRDWRAHRRIAFINRAAAFILHSRRAF
jgi:hypothetical protein